jgi:hypothetical protein
MYESLRARKNQSGQDQNDWKSALMEATHALNIMHRPQLGFETADSVKSSHDEPRIRLAKEVTVCYCLLLRLLQHIFSFPVLQKFPSAKREEEIFS